MEIKIFFDILLNKKIQFLSFNFTSLIRSTLNKFYYLVKYQLQRIIIN